MRIGCMAILLVLQPLAGQTVVPTRGEPVALMHVQEMPGRADRKSPLVATLLSIIVPGTGELYAGNTGTAGYFMAADGILWLTFAGFSLQSAWVMDDARLFARHHAGADFSGKDDRFEAQVGNYLSVQDHNETKLRDRRYDELYEGAAYAWQWRSEQDRLRYRSMRIRSDELSRAAGFVVGALVVNRMISAFSAWRSAKSANGSDDIWHIRAGIQENIPHTAGVGLRLTRVF